MIFGLSSVILGVSNMGLKGIYELEEGLQLLKKVLMKTIQFKSKKEMKILM